jgi:iron complex outermembrane recepter protein
MNRDIANNLPGANPAQQSLFDAPTLPMVGASYKFGDNLIFGSYNTTFRTPNNFTLIQNFSITAGTADPPTSVEAERGQVFEVGHRYQGALLVTSLSAYYGHFTNFQQSTQTVDPTGGLNPVNVTLNIGDVQNYGIQAELGTAPIYNFRPYISGQIGRAELLDNLPTAWQVRQGTTNVRQEGFLQTEGKLLPGAPEYSFAIGLDYDDGHFFANLAYVSAA